MTITVRAEQFVKVTPDEVYFAFTHAISLTEWMCDYATLAPHPGGRMYLWWHGDFYSAGEFISLAENKSIQLKWQTRMDPASSQVEIKLHALDNGTLVSLEHTLPDGKYWFEHAQSFEREWIVTLANLAQVMETGLDKRIFDRPMMGINISDFNMEIAHTMGVPVSSGIRLDFLPEEMSAYQAGLRKDDVVTAIDGKPITNDFESLINAILGKKIGDEVEVVFYRGPERKSLLMKLSRRPLPRIPWEPSELAKAIQAKYAEGLAALAEAFKGVNETEADWRSGPEEWNAKEVLAHLVQTERHWLENLEDILGGYPRLSDDWAGNCTLHVKATVAAHGNVPSLLHEMKLLSEEMVTFVSSLPADFVARKASYLQATNMLIEGSLPHIFSHIDQVRSAIAGGKMDKRK
jgi:uncharacterized protein YndB with AHSA1/START domain